MTTYATGHQVTESCNILGPPKAGTPKVAEESPTTIKTGEDGIRNTVSGDWTKLATSTKLAKQQPVYARDESVDKQNDRVQESGGQTTAEELDDTPQ